MPTDDAHVAGTTRYLLDGLSVIAQYAPDGTRQAWYTQSLARIDEVLSVVNDGGKQWYQADALGSVYGLTNSSGNLVGHQDYDVFGAPTPAPTGPAGQPFGFTGREHELDSGLTYYRDRYMQAALGRWTQADRLGFTAGPNFYTYANGQVTLFADPTGQVVPAMLVLAGIGALYGALFSFVGGFLSGLRGLALLQYIGIGAAAGIASMVIPVSGMAALAVVNGLVTAVGSLVQSLARNNWKEIPLEDFISAAISGAISGLATVFVFYGAKAGVSPIFNEFFAHLSPGEAFKASVSGAATAVGNGTDFIVQALVIPALREVKRRMEIEALFNERYNQQLGICQ